MSQTSKFDQYLPLIDKYLEDYVSGEKPISFAQFGDMLAILVPTAPVSTIKNLWLAYNYLLKYTLHLKKQEILVPNLGRISPGQKGASTPVFTPTLHARDAPNLAKKMFEKAQKGST